ncbi:MAG: hypothetical protein KC656_06025, partial [Myxococcales bacterium]|nr:hypothetical protein [Myxococcales bacterium]
AFSTVMLLLACTLAPLMTSAAMIEEAEDRTLEMLILSELTPSRILMGKVLSRILLLITVVFGALPVLAMVVTLGGVAPHQVVAVVVHALVAIVLTGSLGAFYGLFTRSPMLAMLASVSYAVVAFLLFPGGYILFTAKPQHAAHFSLFAGPATQDWSALISPLSYVPSLVLLFVIGTRLFELRISNADIRTAFAAETWGTRRFVIASVVAFCCGFLVLPASAMLYGVRLADGSSVPARIVVFGSATVVWAWATLLMTLLSWVLLRVGVDVVDALDAILGGRDKREEERIEAHVWGNPVAWREARPAAWAANGMPLLVTWLLLMLGMVQTGWWMIPGGALSMGMLNTAAALGLTVWLSARTVEEERRKDSLKVLLTTTLASWRILAGKALGVAVITAPLMALSMPFFVLGLPYAYVLVEDPSAPKGVDLLVRGALTWGWTLPLWAVLLTGSLLVSLSVKRSRSGFTAALGLLLLALGLPTVLGRLFEDVWLLATPCRLFVPPLAGGASTLQFLVSGIAWSVLAGGLFVVASYGLRRWIVAAMAGLLALGLASAPARAQPIPVQDGFQVLAEPLGEGVVRPEHWAAVRLKVLNTDRETRGRVVLSERQGDRQVTFEREVDLPQGRKDVVLLYQPSTSRAQRTVVLEAPGRRAVATFQPKPAYDQDATVAVLGTDLLGLQLLRTTWGGGIPGRRLRERVDSRDVRAGLVEPGTLPRHAAAWEGFDQLVWPGADPSALDPAQLTAITHWVADGGHLVLTVAENVTALRGTPLADLLPIDLERTEDRTDLGPLGRWAPPPGVLPVAVGRERRTADRQVFTLLASHEGAPLWVTGTWGLGTVSVLTFDPRQLGKGLEGLWRDVLHLPQPSGTPRAPLDGVAWGPDGTPQPIELPREALEIALQSDLTALHNGTTPGDFQISRASPEFTENHDQQVREWLADIPGVAPLPIEWLLVFSGLYLFVIGPLDAIVLRMLRREPWTWVTFPVTIVVFSTVALVGTAWIKGSQAVVSTLERVDLLPGTGLWRGHTDLAVFATERTRIGMQGPMEDAVAWPWSGYLDDSGATAGLGPGVATWTAETWTLGYARTRWIAPAPGTVTLTRTPDGLVVTNLFDFPLHDVEVVAPGEGPEVYDVGPIGPGQRAVVGQVARGISDGTGPLDILRRTFWDAPPDGEGYLSVDAQSYVVLASVDPIAPPPLAGVRPKHRRMSVLRIPIRTVGESP